MGIGGVVRDHDGLPVLMFCSVKGNVSEPTMAEAYGVWKSVDIALQLGLRRIVFEGDSLAVVRALMKDEECWSLHGQVLNDARSKLQNVNEWEIQHVSRAANGDAHNLAKLALGLDQDRLRREDFPF